MGGLKYIRTYYQQAMIIKLSRIRSMNKETINIQEQNLCM